MTTLLSRDLNEFSNSHPRFHSTDVDAFGRTHYLTIPVLLEIQLYRSSCILKFTFHGSSISDSKKPNRLTSFYSLVYYCKSHKCEHSQQSLCSKRFDVMQTKNTCNSCIVSSYKTIVQT